MVLFSFSKLCGIEIAQLYNFDPIYPDLGYPASGGPAELMSRKTGSQCVEVVGKNIWRLLARLMSAGLAASCQSR